MTERPILFSNQMVRAILDNRKTQTRRIIKGAPTDKTAYLLGVHKGVWGIHADVDRDDGVWRGMCRYGVPGGRLWVREGVIQIGHELRSKNGQYRWPKLSDTFTEEKARRWFEQCCEYTADLSHDDPLFDEPHGTLNKLFMPRWASRITLEVTDVRVERLQDISEEDAKSEGVSRLDAGQLGMEKWTSAFRNAWITINGNGSWEENPWVWVVQFEMVKEQQC